MRETPPSEYVLEIVTPRTNAARLSPTEHFFSTLALQVGGSGASPVSLEICADADRRRFLARTGTAAEQRRIAGQLGAAYPQAVLRPFEGATLPAGDPAQHGPDEQVMVATLQLRAGEHLPIRTLDDRDLDERAGSAQADPLLGTLGALGDLPVGWRALVQVVILGSAPINWARAHHRLALESPIAREQARDTGASLMFPLGLVLVLALYMVGLGIAGALDRGDWPAAVGAAGATLSVTTVAVLLIRWLRRRELVDPRLVQVKLAREACQAELRVGVFAPAFADPAAMQARLDRLAAAYQPFNLATGNGLVSRPVDANAVDLRVLQPFARPCLLNVRELAGLWHLVQAGDDVPFVERTTARRRLPLPRTVTDDGGGSCRIGVSAHQGHELGVGVPEGLLRRHLLAIAKTRRGKSSLLLRMASHLMRTGTRAAGGTHSDRRCLVLVDPHRDLSVAALELVPRERQADVVYLDVSNRRRPFGINLLDARLGWDRDQATANALRIFRREFDGFWGPRMEDAFRFAVLALFEANESLCAADPRFGRSAQHTILDVPPLLERRAFRRQVLKRTGDPMIRHWFEGYFDDLDTRLRLEIINPVQTKVHKYLGSRIARQIVGQPKSTIDFRQLITERKIVIINLNAFDVGEDVAALVGGTLLNLAARAISAQATLPPADRQPVTLVVDEFHTLPGADYEQVFGELAKYGANIVLATQTLARLDRLTDAQRTRDLRATVFSNLDGLFAFHTSAEDAAYLAEELGGGLDPQDLLELGHFQCYARLTDAQSGERLPTFSVQLDPPPVGDSALAAMLAKYSAERYGRDALDVELDLQAALERVRGPRQTSSEESIAAPEPATPDQGIPLPNGAISGSEVPEP